jgi:hypothetical protein
MSNKIENTFSIAVEALVFLIAAITLHCGVIPYGISIILAWNQYKVFANFKGYKSTHHDEYNLHSE